MEKDSELNTSSRPDAKVIVDSLMSFDMSAEQFYEVPNSMDIFIYSGSPKSTLSNMFSAASTTDCEMQTTQKSRILSIIRKFIISSTISFQNWNIVQQYKCMHLFSLLILKINPENLHLGLQYL